jgi:beta-lactamase regulating signal transducer with metallopeptidase domain
LKKLERRLGSLIKRSEGMVIGLVNHLWQSTIFVAGMALLTLLLRHNSARLRYALWLSASLKFLVPFALITALAAHISWRSGLATPPPSFVVLMDRIAEPLATPNPTVRHAPSLATWLSHESILTSLAVIWACGVLTVLVFWLRRWRQIRHALHTARPANIAFPIPVRCSTILLEPGVVGFLHPVLLVPDGIEDRLSADQLRAVLAHELCHVRRRDNLTATSHMLVEALLWFYPLIWWLGARLMVERERACDEAVLRNGNNPQAYAEAILQVCQHYLESPLICAAGVSGTNLKRRIEVIMKNQLATRLSAPKKLILAAAAAAAVAMPLVMGLTASPTAHAQSPVVVRFVPAPKSAVMVNVTIYRNGTLVSNPAVAMNFGRPGTIAIPGLKLQIAAIDASESQVDLLVRLGFSAQVETWPPTGPALRVAYGKEGVVEVKDETNQDIRIVMIVQRVNVGENLPVHGPQT